MLRRSIGAARQQARPGVYRTHRIDAARGKIDTSLASQLQAHAMQPTATTPANQVR
ncbi:hypothetical protein [Gemmobacter megaterium]|uniref:hypothetical protein n=1 Tax=Gemmobacter megaterium TaxID=1086013 RepID=UPI0013565699|nr:hypothetical protein [Gemmobacter megaterium]